MLFTHINWYHTTAITCEDDDVLQKASYEAIGKFAEAVPNRFQNFTAPLLVTGKYTKYKGDSSVYAGQDKM